MAVCSDFLDLSSRRLTLHHHTLQHTDFTHPFDQRARFALLDAASELGLSVRDGGVYVTTDGPRYETPAEIHMLRTLGGDMVGMTASSEAILMREAGIPYACLAIVTNLAAGMEAPELTHEEVVEAMQKNSKTAVQLLLNAITCLAER
jgi:5'-methylthioadenosine phosphorylase